MPLDMLDRLILDPGTVLRLAGPFAYPYARPAPAS
jgi:hypothetical protein